MYGLGPTLRAGPLPGSHAVWDREAGELRRCTLARCPYAERHVTVTTGSAGAAGGAGASAGIPLSPAALPGQRVWVNRRPALLTYDSAVALIHPRCGVRVGMRAAAWTTRTHMLNAKDCGCVLP